MEKIARLPGMAYMSDAEYEAFILKERKAYRKRLKMICPSKELRLLARGMADETESCLSCVYANSECLCCIPHTEVYMDAMDIDPCYEGVLFQLCKDAEREEAEREETANELNYLLDKSRDIIYNDLVTFRTLTEMIIGITVRGDKISPAMLKVVRSLNKSANEALDEWEMD